MLFVNFRQPFENVRRLKLFEAMQDMGIHLKFMKLTKMPMTFTEAKIKYENMLSQSFAFNKAVKQLSLIHI